MNILVVAPRYPYKDNMEFVFVKKLVDEWSRRGHHCVVINAFSRTTYIRKRISYRPEYYIDDIGGGIKVQVYNPRFNSYRISFKGISLDDWNASRAIEKQIRKTGIRFDLIYCHFFESALIAFKYAKKNNIPFFVATGESTIGALKKPYCGFEWETFRQYTKGIVAVSSKNKDEAASNGYIDESKCIVFPNGTDTTLFKPLDRIDCRKRLNLPLDAFIISCVGFICERKGQNRLLEAVRLLADKRIKLLFIGSPAKVETFPLNGDEILHKGTVENKDLPVYLGASDIFCLPTLAEGCCNAIVEALACGMPVISSNKPFNWDVLDESNSIMIDPQNIDEMASAIKTLFDDRKRKEILSDGALKKAQSLDIRQRAANIIDFVETRM